MTPEKPQGRNRYDIELAADRYVCYPMEEVTLTVRVTYSNPAKPLLCVHLPRLLDMENARMDGVEENFLSVYTSKFDGTLLVIPIGNYLQANTTADVDITVRLHTISMNHTLSFCAWMDSDIPDKKDGFFEAPRFSRSLEITVKKDADYMRYLPEMYSYDDFVNRFMMFFESFWKPVNTQISQIEDYFDPDLTPEAFLPWLASWVGMEIDDTFPKDKIRLLIKNAILFYHSRGTAESLKMFLELYSSGKVTINERKAQNMVLGGNIGIGDSMALGLDNKPNTVYVDMTVPKSELERTGFTKEKYEKKIASLIRNIVPAHTVFTLKCEYK